MMMMMVVDDDGGGDGDGGGDCDGDGGGGMMDDIQTAIAAIATQIGSEMDGSPDIYDLFVNGYCRTHDVIALDRSSRTSS